MAIQRWDPVQDLRELQHRMNRMIDETLARSAPAGEPQPSAAGGWCPPTDLVEQDDRYLLFVDLPGVQATDVSIESEAGRLVLSGERKLEAGIDRGAYLRVERPHGRFQVQVTLPPSVDPRGIRASHRGGVLEVSLPKRPGQARERVRVPIG